MYGVFAGMAVGLAVSTDLQFDLNAELNLRHVARGASYGLYFGVIMGGWFSYMAENPSSNEVEEYYDYDEYEEGDGDEEYDYDEYEEEVTFYMTPYFRNGKAEGLGIHANILTF